jgi:IS1 family transposase
MKNTIVMLLIDLGTAYKEYQHEHMVDLSGERLQSDGIWSFVAAKTKNVPKEHRGEFGCSDMWTWPAIDADTKLVPRWHIGTRDVGAAHACMSDLAGRLKSHVQLTTDRHRAYLAVVG